MSNTKSAPPPGHPLPRALFTCDHPGCAEEASYYASDLCWYATGKQWICFNCWSDLPVEPDETDPVPGITLEEYIQQSIWIPNALLKGHTDQPVAEFKTEVMATPWPQRDDLKLAQLALEYVERTDAFDRDLCAQHGVQYYYDLPYAKRRKSSDHALQVRQEVRQRAEAAGYNRLQLKQAISRYQQRKEKHE